ncbi:MAG: thioredoxin [Planctomycetota bacterium]
MATEFTPDTFKSVLESEQPVLVDFWGHGCPPCKRLGPVIDELATDNEGKSLVGKVNVHDHQELAVEYGISVIPTILLFKNGEVVERLQGYQDKTDLQALLDSTSA